MFHQWDEHVSWFSTYKQNHLVSIRILHANSQRSKSAKRSIIEKAAYFFYLLHTSSRDNHFQQFYIFCLEFIFIFKNNICSLFLLSSILGFIYWFSILTGESFSSFLILLPQLQSQVLVKSMLAFSLSWPYKYNSRLSQMLYMTEAPFLYLVSLKL